MSDEEIIRQLREQAIPDSSVARGKAVEAAVARRASRRSRRPRWYAALAAVLALVAVSPAGQSVAEEVGDLVGIGDPASLPPTEFPSMISRGNAYVLAAGEVPGADQRYEIVVSRGEFPIRPKGQAGDPGGVETCLTVDFPSQSKLGTGEICGGGIQSWGQPDKIEAVSPADLKDKLDRQSRYVISGLAGADIARIEVTYSGQGGERVTAPSDLGIVGPEIQDLIGVRRERGVGYLVAFIPDDGRPLEAPNRPGGLPREAGVLGTLRIDGFNQDGGLVESFDFGRQYRESIEQSNRLEAQ